MGLKSYKNSSQDLRVVSVVIMLNIPHRRNLDKY